MSADVVSLFGGAMTIDHGAQIPAPITRDGARSLTKRIKRKLADSYDLVTEAYDRRAWQVLDYPTWGAYLQTEFGDLRIVRLTSDQRSDLVAMCREQGMSYREVARQLGISVGAAYNADPDSRKNRDEDQADDVVDDDEMTDSAPDLAPVPDPVAGSDEWFDGLRESDVMRRMFIDLVISKVKAAGVDGITCKALKADMHQGHQRVSAALSRATASHRLDYLAPEKRGQHGLYVWVAPEVSGE